MHQQTKRDLISFLGYILCCLSICLTYLAPVFNKEWFEDIAEVKDIKLFPVGADDWLGISSAEYDSHCGDAIGGRTLIEALDGPDETTTFVASTPPTITVAPWTKLEPIIVIDVPPAIEALLGEIARKPGGAM